MEQAERARLRAELQTCPILGDGDRLIPPCLKALDALEAAEAEATRYREWIREWQDQDPYPWAEDSDRCHYCGHKGGANRSHYPECAWQQARDLLAATEPEGQ